MKVQRSAPSLRMEGEDSEVLIVRQDNRGEPYREGVSLTLEFETHRESFSIFLSEYEAKRLRDRLNELYPTEKK